MRTDTAAIKQSTTTFINRISQNRFGVVTGREWIFIIVFFACNALVLGANLDAIINNPITQDTVVALQSSHAQSVTVDATAILPHENSLVRIVVTDSDGVDHLLTESYPIISGTGTITIANACEETCYAGFTPKELKIIIEDATITITKITITPATTQSKGAMGETQAMYAFAQVQESKIDKINQRLQARGARWIAGETSVSQLSYEEKKRLFADQDGNIPEDLPNLGGFEYYTSGVFEMPETGASGAVEPTTTPASTELPASWDWRNVHGENWMTPVKNQGIASTCWMFSLLGATEAQINLHYNQHIDIDLSEQQMTDCFWQSDNPLFDIPDECKGKPFDTQEYCTLKMRGVADEGCDPYAEIIASDRCTAQNVCADVDQRTWKAGNERTLRFENPPPIEVPPTSEYGVNDDRMKRLLISEGPLHAHVTSWGHSMTMVGYADRGDWKTVESCFAQAKMCVPGEGCVAEYCDTLGETKEACGNTERVSYNGEKIIEPTRIKYNCTDDWGSKKWEVIGLNQCGERMMCSENNCVPGEYAPKAGDIECAVPGYRGLFNERQEYIPGEGERYWIFKNSWGPAWGENGYVRVSLSSRNLGEAGVLSGPFTPPTNQAYWPAGFDNTIKCFDKDNDNYCNWGITPTMPSTCPSSCEPEKDCNDANPVLGPFDENLNCVPNTQRMPITHEVQGKYLTLNYNGTPPYRIRIGATSGTGDGGYVQARTFSGEFNIALDFATNPTKIFYYTAIDAEGKQGRGSATID